MIGHRCPRARFAANAGGAQAWAAVVTVISLVGLGGGCTGGSNEESATPTTTARRPLTAWAEDWSEDPPFPVRELPRGSGTVLGVGDAFVAIPITETPGESPAHVAIRGPDGRWGELPQSPPIPNASLIAVGDTVALAGPDCASEDCVGEPRRAMFVLDSGRWEPVDMSAAPRADTLQPWPWQEGTGGAEAVLSLGDELFSLNTQGDLAQLPTLPNRSYDAPLVCLAGDELVLVTMFGNSVTAPREVFSVHSLDLAHADRGWVKGPDPPEATQTGGVRFCGPEGPVLVWDGVETTYVATDSKWTQRGVVLPEPLASYDDTTLREVSVLDDGTTVLLTSPRNLYIRRASGSWENPGLYGDALASNGDAAVLYTDVDTGELVEVPL